MVRRYLQQYKSVVVLFLFLISVIVCMFFVYPQSHVDAAAPFQITGYAWSENIGWIEFNSATHNVQIANNRNITGYAWSEHIGWIQFGGVGCPANNVDVDNVCTASVISDGGSGWEMTGWARALAYQDPQAGGWEGWISLNCKNTNTCGATAGLSDYAIRITRTGSIVGGAFPSGSFAWGADVLGWTDFSPATITNFCGTNTTDRCLSPTVSEATTGDLWCGAPTIVQTTCVPTDRCNAGPTGTGLCETPVVSIFTATPKLIRPGKTVTISWSVSVVGACIVKGSGTPPLSGGPIGSGQSGPLFNQTKLILNCDGLDVASTTVKVLPTTQET